MNDAPALSAAQCGIAVEDEPEGGAHCMESGPSMTQTWSMWTLDDHELVRSCNYSGILTSLLFGLALVCWCLTTRNGTSWKSSRGCRMMT